MCALAVVLLYNELKSVYTAATSEKTLATEDTDLIELALVTLTLLDKVLHLLRDLKLGLRLVKLRIRSA